jgi:hypothetical protein
MQIYKGALPFIGLQVVVLTIVITFPGLVTHYKDVPPPIPGGIQQGLPGMSGGALPGLPGSTGGGLSPLQLSPLGVSPQN